MEDVDSEEPWPEHFTTELSTFLSPEKVLEVKQIYLEGLANASMDPSEALKRCQPIASKETRTALHHTVRRLFKGKMDSETGEGSCIVIRWARQGRGGRGTLILKIIVLALTRFKFRRVAGYISSLHSFLPSKNESGYARCAGATFSSLTCQRERSFCRRYQGQAGGDSSAGIFQTRKQDGRGRVD